MLSPIERRPATFCGYREGVKNQIAPLNSTARKFSTVKVYRNSSDKFIVYGVGASENARCIN
jgi:hypothetical protein